MAAYQQTAFFQRLRENEPPPTPPAVVRRDEYGTEYEDGSYRAVCGLRYDPESELVLRNDGSEWEGAAAAKTAEEKKQQIRGACQRAESRQTN